MNARNWDPFNELIQLQDRTDRLLRGGFGSSRLASLEMPAMDVFEEGGSLVVEASLPNFDEKDIEVNLTDGGVELKAEHSSVHETTKRKYILHETTSGGFYRYINLPAGANVDGAKATFDNGILRIEIPMGEEPHQKSLPINSNDSKSESPGAKPESN
jgi:HSP20 family protein